MMTLFMMLMLFQTEGEGFTLERDVELVFLDTLDRRREIHRRERVSYHAGNLLIEDLTFGEILLVRSDLKTVWVIDTLAGTWSKLGFDQIKKRQSEILDEIAETRRRVSGTTDQKSLTLLLESYGRFATVPKVEIRTPGKSRELLGKTCSRKDLYVNGDMRRMSVYVESSISSDGYLQTLGHIGRFSKEESIALKGLGGLPLEGTIRYVSFLNRVQARIRTVSLQTKKFSPDDFAPPSGGKEVRLAGFQKPAPREIKRPEGFGKDNP